MNVIMQTALVVIYSIMSHNTIEILDPCFVYEPAYMTCDLTYYSDTTNRQINGLLVVKVHYDPRLYKMASGISTSDLSTYYLPDLLSLLSMKESTYKESVKNHKSLTNSFNFIDYDELKQIYEYVDSLFKMSGRLKVIGCAATSILYDQRKLNTGVCIDGQITEPDNLFVPTFHLFDNKIHDVQFICDFLLTGSRNRHYFSHQDTCLRKYAMSGSIIYLILYKRKSVYDYIIYVSEEPIQPLIQTIIENIEFATDFDFIHTVIGRTNTREESTPYVITHSGFYFKSVILYCNENSFTKPILLTYRKLLAQIKRDVDDSQEYESFESTTLSSHKDLHLLEKESQSSEYISAHLNQVARHVVDSQDYDSFESSSLSRNDLQIDNEFQSEYTSGENPRKEHPTNINIPFLSSCLAFCSDQEPIFTVIDQLFSLLLQHRDNISEDYQPIRDILDTHQSLLDDIIDCSGILDRIDKTQFDPIVEAYSIAEVFLYHYIGRLDTDKLKHFLSSWFNITHDTNINNLQHNILIELQQSNRSFEEKDSDTDSDTHSDTHSTFEIETEEENDD